MSVKEYWIDVIQQVKEFDAIALAEDGEIVALNDSVASILDDQFIETARESGIARREKMLKITPFADDTLESRRFRVTSKWGDGLPYTYKTLIERLEQLCGENGFVMSLDHEAYSLHVLVELTVKRMEDEVRYLTRKMSPANISITVELRYNQHKTVKRFTHAQLRAMTHTQIRGEALE